MIVVITQVFKQRFFKSALAFFFLFFLHGFSIGTRQQGISYNGLRLCVCLPLAQSFKLPQMLMGQIAQNRYKYPLLLYLFLMLFSFA